MSVSEFLELYGKENTKAVYRAGLKRFFKGIYGEDEDVDKLAERYLSDGRNHFQDLLKFAASLSDRPPITARSYFSGVKEWLAMNDITFTERQLKMARNKLPKGNARTVEDEIDPAKLRKILQHLDVKGRALVLVLASSGMRIGEALKITIDDLKLDREPAEITIRGEYTKTGEQRYVFISREAKEALIEWLKVREDYLRQAKNKNKGLIKKGKAKAKNVEDDRVFPFSVEVANQTFSKALKKAGLLKVDKTTGRKKLHIHMLRKFFRSQLAQKVPVDIVEAMLGHSGYLTEAYRRYTKKQMAEFYKQGEDLLTINMPEDIREIRNEFREKMEKQRELIEDLILENRELKRRMAEMEKSVMELEKMFRTAIRALWESKDAWKSVVKVPTEIARILEEKENDDV
ncbi:hypothetical protein DRP04_07550 [Archaeoglobales archaeon]|nr:MAG: hypothetical protein DRP04_07550 [Archaeoglobales archaeon]